MAGFVVALVLIPFSSQVQGRLETAVHVLGGQSEDVDYQLAHRFNAPYAHRVVLVVSGLPDADSSAGADALQRMTSSLRSVPGVAGAASSLDWPDPLFTGKKGGALIIVGLEEQGEGVEALIPKLRIEADSLQSRLKGQFPEIKLEITGETPLNFDLRKVSSDDVHTAESRALPVTLVLLVIAFGSLVAALLPLGVGVLAISMTMGAAALMAHFMHLSILIQNLATMLGLGLGIDYALLMVSRFRDALAEGLDAGRAADLAARQAGKTLVISALTVAIGFSALLTVPITELRSLGVAGLVVTLMSVLLCTMILPWVLGLLGHRINYGRVRLPGHWLNQSGAAAQSVESRWRKWGTAVTSHPWKALLLVGTPLLLLASQGRRITPGLPIVDWLPASAESVQALHSLQDMGRDGIVQSMRLVVELPPGVTPTSPAGWQAISRLTSHLSNDSRTEEVISLATLAGNSDSPDGLADVPVDIRKGFTRDDEMATLVEVLPSDTVTPVSQLLWVRELRSADVGAITGVPGTKLMVGGIPGLDADYDAVVKERLPKVVFGVVIGSFLALLLGLRSVVAALKAVLLNLLSVGAAFGALVLVFQDGHGIKLLGISGATGTVFPIVPILSFAIVFGLSMDYEVFLVARVLEERRRGLSEQAAVVEGLAKTAGLITSAAAIMIAVFAAFTMGSFLAIKMLGFTLAVAVFLDATAVRMVVGPALLQLAGDWNWWPYGLAGSSASKASGDAAETET